MYDWCNTKGPGLVVEGFFKTLLQRFPNAREGPLGTLQGPLGTLGDPPASPGDLRGPSIMPWGPSQGPLAWGPSLLPLGPSVILNHAFGTQPGSPGDPPPSYLWDPQKLGRVPWGLLLPLGTLNHTLGTLHAVSGTLHSGLYTL